MTESKPFNITPSTLRTLERIAPDEELHAAALRFDALKRRTVHPDTKRDNGGRHFLRTRYACCADIRTPSKMFPFSEMLHGRTAIHLAHSLDIPERAADIQSYRNLMNKHPELRIGVTIARAALSADVARRSFAEIDDASKAAAKRKPRRLKDVSTSDA